MNIRCLAKEDLPTIEDIWERHYRKEFDVEDLFENTLGMFAVEEEKRIICIGGVRPIAEAVLMTDKDVSVRTRLSALMKVLDVSEMIAKGHNFDQLHAFVQSSRWERHLARVGFRPTVGQALVKIL